MYSKNQASSGKANEKIQAHHSIQNVNYWNKVSCITHGKSEAKTF